MSTESHHSSSEVDRSKTTAAGYSIKTLHAVKHMSVIPEDLCAFAVMSSKFNIFSPQRTKTDKIVLKGTASCPEVKLPSLLYEDQFCLIYKEKVMEN